MAGAVDVEKENQVSAVICWPSLDKSGFNSLFHHKILYQPNLLHRVNEDKTEAERAIYTFLSAVDKCQN